MWYIIIDMLPIIRRLGILKPDGHVIEFRYTWPWATDPSLKLSPRIADDVFSIAFPWVKGFVFWLTFNWSFVPIDIWTNADSIHWRKYMRHLEGWVDSYLNMNCRSAPMLTMVTSLAYSQPYQNPYRNKEINIILISFQAPWLKRRNRRKMTTTLGIYFKRNFANSISYDSRFVILTEWPGQNWWTPNMLIDSAKAQVASVVSTFSRCVEYTHEISTQFGCVSVFFIVMTSSRGYAWCSYQYSSSAWTLSTMGHGVLWWPPTVYDERK